MVYCSHKGDITMALDEDVHFERCPLCGEEFEADDMKTVDTDDGIQRICEDCYYEQQGYVRCENCDMLFPEDEIEYHDFSYDEIIEDGYYCKECSDEKYDEIYKRGVSIQDGKFLEKVEYAMEELADTDLFGDEPEGMLS